MELGASVHSVKIVSCLLRTSEQDVFEETVYTVWGCYADLFLLLGMKVFP
ncbi:Uncharacterised protein [Corynebacterium ulcerans]|uniref:Uncharacterized protein n=1 Tax=Corynebacterium ulcerans TaxID=65058 RepID=A0ABD7MQR7_CORUL|nr:Uncharacterised protein [Corynebacterium ulcerans]SQG50082.1 Uncharacterised protein [Corynebacterium ulcerans]SQG59197.1 Uncharacterised protein [Corynebacterium ulcerans]SQH03689.1 Uncharacterised protein [Corynebacterium ulcerans]